MNHICKYFYLSWFPYLFLWFTHSLVIKLLITVDTNFEIVVWLFQIMRAGGLCERIYLVLLEQGL